MKSEGDDENIKVVPKSKILEAMPETDTAKDSYPPVLYKQGVIYTAVKQKRFRALRVRGDRYTESGASYSKDPKAAWAKVVDAIDKHK